ncbi:glucosamine-6-phosphate deaminase-like protein [Streptomyces sp. ADI97-07]|uniref:PIG-L deacetylase family protein n=1 Tax=Streptomyces sp. ADI97-07 TaxID=1522762 RepID=UPI000F5557A8|nr:PIG-L family deacetylase [Streptomyces sp. ADI97-07]RPK85817.1 glucosamine-6-phosphate deaminase-like protein [Streptomyces sp. ADI97-07]
MTTRTDGAAGYADAIQAPGTDESVWRAWTGWKHLREFPLPPGGRVVVVAAHPDDEVLGLGGTLARLAAAGRSITVVTVTDGEASHPDSRMLLPRELADERAAETRTALERLGAGSAEIVRLHVPDSGVDRHEDEVRRALVPLCSGAALVAAPWTGDVHSDHEAAGRAARAAAAEVDAPFAEYPVWMWHWAHPGDSRVPWERARCLSLPAEIQQRKRHAVDAFVSQILPLGPGEHEAAVLPPEELAHHLRPVEVVFQ